MSYIIEVNKRDGYKIIIQQEDFKMGAGNVQINPESADDIRRTMSSMCTTADDLLQVVTKTIQDLDACGNGIGEGLLYFKEQVRGLVPELQKAAEGTKSVHATLTRYMEQYDKQAQIKNFNLGGND